MHISNHISSRGVETVSDSFSPPPPPPPPRKPAASSSPPSPLKGDLLCARPLLQPAAALGSAGLLFCPRSRLVPCISYRGTSPEMESKALLLLALSVCLQSLTVSRGGLVAADSKFCARRLPTYRIGSVAICTRCEDEKERK